MAYWKKFAAAIGAATIGLLGLTACGSSNSKSGDENTIQFFSTKTENADTYKKLIAKFEKQNPGIKIAFQAPPDAGTVLKTSLTKNSVPDIVAIGGDANFIAMDKAGVFEDLSGKPYVKDVADEYKKMITSLSKNEKLTAVPYATNASGVIYNKELFEKAGISETPKTWDEFMRDAKKLKNVGITPFGAAYKDAWTTLPPWNQAAGIMIKHDFYKERQENKVTFAATHKEVMQRWLDILPYAQTDFMGTSYDDINRQFAEGKIAMIVNGNYEIPEITKLDKNIKLDMFMTPMSNNPQENKVISGVDVAFAVSKQAKNKEAIDKFLAFMMQPDNATQYIDEQFAMSAIKGISQKSPLVAGIAKEVEEFNVAPYPDHYYPTSLDVSQNLSQAALNYQNKMSDSENIKKTLEAIDKAYDAANVGN